MALSKSRELVIEQRSEQATIVEDAAQTDGRTVFEAIVSEGDYVNANGRMYPIDILWAAFEQVNADIAAYPGAVDHPETPHLSFSDNGIAWERFWREGNYIKGRGRIIRTVRGNDLAANLEAGVKVGFSTRTYINYEERDIGGRTVRVVTEMEPPFVDAVVNPSVRHARGTNVSKEEQEKVDEELRAALEQKGAAESKLAEAQSALESERSARAAAEGRVAELTSQVEGLTARVAELEAEAQERAEREAADAFENRLVALTSEHPFGAAIRNEVKALVEAGISVTLDTLEGVVARMQVLVESAAAKVNEEPEGGRGDLSTNEDTETEATELTEEQRAELEGAGLL